MAVSIPLEQGGVFRPFGNLDDEDIPLRLNPFRTGQGLSTTNHNYLKKVYEGFQSLWNRAVSFDCKCLIAGKAVISLNPFRTRRCLSTQ